MLRQSNTPGGLAAELAAAKERQATKEARANDRLAKARAKHERDRVAAEAQFVAAREGVIERGVTRIAQITDLQKELERERLDLERVVQS